MRLKTFCGCLPLKVGVILMGSLTVIWALIAIVGLSVLLGIAEYNHYDPGFRELFKIAHVAVMTYVIVIGVTGALMIHGARKKEPGFIFPWLARATADLLLSCAGVFSYIITSPMVLDLDNYFIFLAIASVIIALHVYVWFVIYSFYKQITVEKYSCAGFCSEEKMTKKPLNAYHHF